MLWFVPFAAMALVTQISGLLDVTLKSPFQFSISTCVLAIIGISVIFVRGGARRLVATAAPLAYVVSLTLLILSQPQSSTGLQVAVLLPVLWVAIYGGRLQSAVMVVVVLASILFLALEHHTSGIVLVRSLVLWCAMTAVLSVAIHGFRRRLEDLREQLARQATTDPLTGLANRRGFEELIAERRGRRSFVLMSVDVTA